jgi:iron complex transport system substrate-binding protein
MRSRPSLRAITSSPCSNRTYTLDLRIASLLASATEIVAFLGLDHKLVGVSADSDYPPEAVDGLPVLNTITFDAAPLSSREIDAVPASHGHQGASLYHVDPDLLRTVRPDLILTREVCEVCSVARSDVDVATELLGYTPKVVSLNAVTLDQVFNDIETVARLGGVATGTAALRERV